MSTPRLKTAIENGNRILNQLTALEKTYQGETPTDPTLLSEWEELHRAWWTNSAETLSLFVDCQMTPTRLEGHPYELLKRLQMISENLGGGHIPPVISNSKKSGAFELGEREGIAVALYYLEAVEEKSLLDSSPVKTVSEAYGVKRQAVQKWKREKDKRLAGLLKSPPDVSVLRSHLSAAGLAYKKWGRYGSERKKRE